LSEESAATAEESAASAQESAAVAQEMSSQSALLKKLISQFKLKDKNKNHQSYRSAK
jgi:methyl-accepting chemotaxis protein